MSAPLCMVGKAYVALVAEILWDLVVLLLMAFKQSAVRCFVGTQITIPHYSFVY